MLLLVLKTSTVYSPNSLHLEISGFIRQDFSCCTNKEIRSVFHKGKMFSSLFTSKLRYKEKIFQLVQIILKGNISTVFSEFNVIGFEKKAEFEFQFALRVPRIS